MYGISITRGLAKISTYPVLVRIFIYLEGDNAFAIRCLS